MITNVCYRTHPGQQNDAASALNPLQQTRGRCHIHCEPLRANLKDTGVPPAKATTNHFHQELRAFATDFRQNSLQRGAAQPFQRQFDAGVAAAACLLQGLRSTLPITPIRMLVEEIVRVQRLVCRNLTGPSVSII